MKKDTPAPEQHPVDAFFREQEPNIPVSFDPAHWDALQLMLDQPATAGTHVSDPALNSLRPAFGRFIRMVLIVAFLSAVPSSNPASRQAMYETFVPENVPDGKTFPTTQTPFVPETSDSRLNSEGAVRQDSPEGRADGQSPDRFLFSKVAATPMPLNADTLLYGPLMPAGMVVDSLSRHTDSLSILKSLNAAQDSMAIKRKKKKHLFW